MPALNQGHKCTHSILIQASGSSGAFVVNHPRWCSGLTPGGLGDRTECLPGVESKFAACKDYQSVLSSGTLHVLAPGSIPASAYSLPAMGYCSGRPQNHREWSTPAVGKQNVGFCGDLPNIGLFKERAYITCASHWLMNKSAGVAGNSKP